MAEQITGLDINPLEKQMLDDVFDTFQVVSGGELITLMHVQGQFTRFSPAAVKLLGLPGEYVHNGAARWAQYIHPEDRKRYLDIMARLIAGKVHTYDLTYRIQLKSGEYSTFRTLGGTVRNERGESYLIGGVMLNQGLTESTDPVTVLPNKNALCQAIEAVMKRGQRACILQIGFRGLSKLNENHGYSFGNHVLLEVAWLIQEKVGSRGKVYRLDSGSFAVFSSTITREELAAVYDTLRIRLRSGVRVEGIQLNLIASGGMISVEEKRVDPFTVLSFLQSAYRESKRYRQGELVDFNGSIHFDENDTLEMVNVIRECILDGCRGFSLCYQPVIDNRSGQVIGAEALLRWEGEPYGVVAPLDFLPILETDFVFEELGLWILRRVMEDGGKFLEKAPAFQVSVNISSSQLEDEYFLDTLTETLEDTGFPAKNLCLEVSKGCRLLRVERLREVVEAMHKIGVCVIIDDFGAGFESVGFLKKLSADYIKFDRELIKDVERSESDREIMASLARCAEAQGTCVIAKGVETEETRAILQAYHINRIQGNLYSKPISFEEVMAQCFPG